MNRVILGVIAVALFFPLAAAVADDADAGEPGILIARVIEDSPAQKAGILRGDIILEVESISVNTVTDLRDLLSDFEGGDTVAVLISRGGAERTLRLELETRLYRPAFGIESAPGGGHHFSFMSDSHDFSMRPRLPGFPFGPGEDRFMFADHGDLVTMVVEDSPADRAGIAEGDIIVRVGDVTLDDTTVASAITDLSPNDRVEIELRRDNGDGELDTVVVRATLGTNDDGGAYLGIGFMPLRMMHMDDSPDFYGRGFPFSRSGMEGPGGGMRMSMPRNMDI